MTVLAEGPTLSGGTEAWLNTGLPDGIPPGEKHEVTLPDGRLVLLVGTDAGVFATCADCPHQDTPLVDGTVEGTILTCPVHFWQWDMRTGEPVGLAELPLPTFQVKVESGYLFVRRTPRG